MKVIIDMNLSPAWQDTLTAAGIDAAHWTGLGAPNALDREIMDFARDTDSIVLTYDLDFSAILAVTNQDKPSVVQLRAEDTSPLANGAAVIAAIRQCEAELEQGALVTVDPLRFRLTLLPLTNNG